MSASARALEVLPVSRVFQALADEQRLRIVALVSHGELWVCHLQSALELPQPTVSRLLGVLKRAGVVDVRREGAWAYYRLARLGDPWSRAQVATLARAFGKAKLLKSDVERLVKSRGPGACK